MRALVFTLAAALALAGCGHHFQIHTPDRFVELEPGAQERMGFAYRATSANGAVLAVREIDNDRHASAEFWVEAVRNRVRRAGGYALLSESEVRSADGRTGHQMRFGRDEGQHPYAYWVTLFVTPDRIFVVEAGGRREPFEAEQASIEQAIGALRLE
ncbi:MAG: serine/threonine protein kinase [Sandaracinaceae bacterium]|nr:serine/threonine protein kinase [Sandaracinaceae bacterium]